MKNYKLALSIFIIILFLTFISSAYTRKNIDYIEAQIRIIEEVSDFDESYQNMYIRLKEDFHKRKKYLKKVINKNYIYDIEAKIYLLENSIKEKDITSTRENCLEIMSILDNIESCYLEIS